MLTLDQGRLSRRSSYSLSRSDGPYLLRVVRCLPSRAGVRGRDDATRAGVAQASREETAACPDAVPGS